jgi:hypothetical protein
MVDKEKQYPYSGTDRPIIFGKDSSVCSVIRISNFGGGFCPGYRSAHTIDPDNHPYNFKSLSHFKEIMRARIAAYDANAAGYAMLDDCKVHELSVVTAWLSKNLQPGACEVLEELGFKTSGEVYPATKYNGNNQMVHYEMAAPAFCEAVGVVQLDD